MICRGWKPASNRSLLLIRLAFVSLASQGCSQSPGGRVLRFVRGVLILTNFLDWVATLALADKCCYVVVSYQMASNILPFNTLAQVYAHTQDDSALHRYTMDMVLEGSLFYCKLITPARLINTANEVKKTSVCLFFDASHVQGLGVCDNDEEVIPSCVKSAFVKQASSTSAADLMSIRFVLKGHAPLVAPDSMLQKRPSMFKDIEALLRMGRSDTFKVYLPSSAVSRKHLLGLSDALARGMKPAPENVINSIYRKPFKSKIVTRLDELWGLNEPENPPPYDLSTVPGASNDEPSSQSDFRDTSSSGKRGKRRMASPVSRQTPSKRQFLTEKADPEPWELAFAAQGAQIAALCAELHTLREEMQRFRRASMVDAETQTDPPAEAEAKPGSSLDYASPSQASTVENTIEDRLLMVEDSILEEQLRRALSDEKLENTEKQLALLDEKLENTNKQVSMQGHHGTTITRWCPIPPTFSLHMF